jgi:hypothetical protein
MTELYSHLRAVAEALPTGTVIPVPSDVLIALLDQTEIAYPDKRDLTVMDLCTLFGRRPSAVRAWLERGDLFPNAYKLNGKAWRVPAIDVDVFKERQRAGCKSGDHARGTHAPTADLSAWRRIRRD